MDLSLADAASAVKRTKQALAQAVQRGRLSATKDANGQWRIDTAELFRVYPPDGKDLDQAGDKDLVVLRTRLAELEAQHHADRELIAELRVARDQWQRQAETLLLALPAGLAPPTAAPTAAVAPTPTPGPENGPGIDESAPGGANGRGDGQTRKKRGFWGRVFGGGGHGE